MQSSNDSASHSRRTFLKAATAAVGVAPAWAAPDRRPHLQFPAAARDRLAVTSYPFRTLIESPKNPARDKTKPGMDLKEFPAMIAKRFGVHNINPLADHLSSTDPGYLEEFRKAVAAAHSHVVDLGLGSQDFSSSPNSEEAVAFGRKGIDIAVLVGSPSVRQHLKAPSGAKPSVENTAANLARLADYGAKKNVIVNIENDSPGSEDPFFIADVLDKANHPYLCALPDFGNSLRGHDAAYNHKAVDRMFKRVCNMCHVKNVLRTKEGQVYRVDVPDLFAVARANSYRGYFSMEFDTAAGDPFEGTSELVKLSLKYM